jgi:hypothetical protein
MGLCPKMNPASQNELPKTLKPTLTRGLRWLGPVGVLKRIVQQELFSRKIARIYSTQKKKPYRECFLLCGPRTGSNLLMSYLNSHPQVSIGGEVFSQNDPAGLSGGWVSKKMAFDHLRHFLHYLDRPVCGAKIMFPHLQMRGISLDEMRRQFPNSQWIVLYRENILDQYISYKIAWKTNRWTQSRATAAPLLKEIRFALDPAEAIHFRNWVLRCHQEALRSTALQNSRWVSYETLTDNPRQLFAESVFPYLKLPPVPVSTRFVKQNIWNYSEILTNYAEVKNFIETTNFIHRYDRQQPPS